MRPFPLCRFTIETIGNAAHFAHAFTVLSNPGRAALDSAAPFSCTRRRLSPCYACSSW